MEGVQAAVTGTNLMCHLYGCDRHRGGNNCGPAETLVNPNNHLAWAPGTATIQPKKKTQNFFFLSSSSVSVSVSASASSSFSSSFSYDAAEHHEEENREDLYHNGLNKQCW